MSIADDLRQLKRVFPFVERSVRDIDDVAYRHGLKQVNYAATGAWACRELYLRFREIGLV